MTKKHFSNTVDTSLAELEAQRQILQTLKPVGPDAAARVLLVVKYLCEADALCPGVLEQFLRGRRTSND